MTRRQPEVESLIPMQVEEFSKETHLTSDCCLRCFRLFKNGEICQVVRGGPNAKYRDLAILVHFDCLQEDNYDVAIGVTRYIATARNRTNPIPFVYGRPMVGYVKVSHLDDGTWRIALHRGHAEIYAPKERASVEETWKNGPFGAYSPDGLYSTVPLAGDWRKVVRLEWIDLSCPRSVSAQRWRAGLVQADNSRPWMTALEMQFAALAHGENGDASDNRRRRVAALRMAETYAWSRDIVAAVTAGSRTIPIGSMLSRSAAGSNPSWWWFGDAMPIMINAGGDPNVCALLLDPQADGLEITGFMPTDDARCIPVPFDSWLWAWDVGLDPERMGRRALRGDEAMARQVLARTRGLFELSRVVLAGTAWLHQRVIVCSLGGVERHRRKQLAREYNAPLRSDVKVIQLRRAEPRSHVDGEHVSVDWSCRWVVGGHWRNQPYKDARKLLYILPYVKGPEDKPLKVPTHQVYAVNR